VEEDLALSRASGEDLRGSLSKMCPRHERLPFEDLGVFDSAAESSYMSNR
jgi:hypothetical protein